MCCRDYTACMFAVIWSMGQTLFHIGMCVWGTNMFLCTYEIREHTFQYFWYLTYFYTDSCINASFDTMSIPYAESNICRFVCDDEIALGFNKTVDLQNIKLELEAELLLNESTIEFPPESAAAVRTYNIFTVYVVVDALWIITAVGLLVGTVFRVRYAISAALYFPWTAVLLFVLFFDAVTSVWYGTDIVRTNGITNWFLFIGAQNQSIFEKLEYKYSKTYFTIPSILMTALFSRFILIWIVNLFLFFRIVQSSINAYQDFNDEESVESKNASNGQCEKADVTNNRRTHHFQVCEVDLNSTEERIRRWQLYYGSDDEEEKEERAARRPPRRFSKQKQINEGWKKDNDFQYDKPTKSHENLKVPGGYEGDRSSSPSPLPEQRRNSSRYETNELYVSFNEQKRPLPAIALMFEEMNQKTQQSGASTAGELRSQLPWSYFQDRSNITIPKAQLQSDIMPPVPVPDYTLKLNNKEKRNVL